MEEKLPPMPNLTPAIVYQPWELERLLGEWGRACFEAGMEQAKAIADSYTKYHASATTYYIPRWHDASEYHSARMGAGSQIRDAIDAAIRQHSERKG